MFKNIFKKTFSYLFRFYLPMGLLTSVAVFFISGIPLLMLLFSEGMEGQTGIAERVIALIIATGTAIASAALYYWANRKRVERLTVFGNAAVLLILSAVFTRLMTAVSGSVGVSYLKRFFWFCIQYCPLMLLSNDIIPGMIYLPVFASMLTALIMSVNILKNKNTEGTASRDSERTPLLRDKRYTVVAVMSAALLLAFLGACTGLYLTRPETRYGGHGFDYMNGYSSVYLDKYKVSSDSPKLPLLAHEPSLVISGVSNMPIMDGAEACYPVYASAARAVYKDIDSIESGFDESPINGRVVTFTNSVQGFSRLINSGSHTRSADRVDLFFGARPSDEQLAMAEKAGVELEITPIGRDGFVFFVDDNNPVNGLTSEQIRSIYSGSVRNWSELGGKYMGISAYQRPKYSGSQTAMERFMGDVPLMAPKTDTMVEGMANIVTVVAEYGHEEGAIGYSFRCFLEELAPEEGIKMLAVDGVRPTEANIADGLYPLSAELCLITRKDDNDPNVRRMIEFMLSDDGQYLVGQCGYVPINKCV